MKIAEKINFLSDYFKKILPNPQTELEFNSAYQLLIATLLAAQCTDKRVNIVTKVLFRVAPTPEKMIKLSQEEVENYIRSINYYKTKAKHVLEASRLIIENFNGKVPADLEALQTLPGVGRKTASVVLVCAFDIPAFPVDTHVFRVSNRIGIVKEDDVAKTEAKLRKILDPKDWYRFHHYFILHGRYTCKAQNPNCAECGLKEVCDFYKKKR